MAVYDTVLSRTNTATVIGPGWARENISAPFIVAMTTAMLDNANDDVGLLWVPAGAVVTGIRWRATDMDSGTALVIDIGDSADEDRLVSASTLGQAGGESLTLASTGFLYKYAAQTQIRAYINTAAGTAVAGTLSGVIQYFVDENFSVTPLTATV